MRNLKWFLVMGYLQVCEGPADRHRYQMTSNTIFFFFVMVALSRGKCNIFNVPQEVVDHFLLIYSLLFLIKLCVHSSGAVISEAVTGPVLALGNRHVGCGNLCFVLYTTFKGR
jgi:hypothetical protein